MKTMPVQLYSYAIFQRNNNVIPFKSAQQKDSAKKTVAVMAPLLIDINDKQEWDKFNKDLQKAKAAGAEAISVDVWWGNVEAQGDEKFDWHYYDAVFDAIQKHKLHIVPIMSFHKCGGNVGDNVDIPIPKWAWNVASPGNKNIKNVMYKNEQDKYIDDVIPIWYDDSIKGQYSEFMRAFKQRYLDNPKYKGIVDEVNISLGPSGELRYPAYGQDTARMGTNAPYPQRGNFVGYSETGKKSFRNYLQEKYKNIDALNNSWGSEYRGFEEVGPPDNKSRKNGRAQDFIEDEAYIKTQDGLDFIDWYNSSLVNHGRMMLDIAREEFGKDITLGMKIPGIHWGIGVQKIGDFKNARIPEIATGIISVDAAKEYNKSISDYGYKNVLDLVKESNSKGKTVLHFTCLEKLDGTDLNPSHSLAGQLVNLMLEGAKRRFIPIKGENARDNRLENKSLWYNMLQAMNSGYDGITLLRLGSVTAKNSMGNLRGFSRQVKGQNAN